MRECSCGRAPYEFYKDKNTKDGLDTKCKQCRKDWCATNKDKRLIQARKFQEREKARNAIRRKAVTHVRMKQLHTMAKSHVMKWNKPHLETELASDLILRAARGQDITQNTVSKAFIDIMRSFSGRKGSKNYEPTAVSWNELNSVNENKLHVPSSYDSSLDIKDFVDRKYPSQKPCARACYFLKYVYGLTMTEICEVFGTFPMNVMPVLDGVEADLKGYLGVAK